MLRIAVKALIISILLTGCSKAMNTPDIKQNPHPTKRYEITMKINGAQGSFDSITGYVLYQVAEDDCLPLRPGSGARLALRKDIPVAFEKLDANTYKAEIFADLLLDENYYGLGVCHWQVASSGASIKLNSFSFNAGMDFNEVRSQKPVVTYFSKQSYSEAKANKLDTDNGTTLTAYVTQHPTEFFSVTLTSGDIVK